MRESDRKQTIWVLLLLAAAYSAGFFNGFLVGRDIAQKQCQDAAIAAGVARWVVNEETGERTFHYGAK